MSRRRVTRAETTADVWSSARAAVQEDGGARDGWMEGLHLYSASLTSGHSKQCTILPHIHPFMNTFTHRWRCQPCKATASSSGAARGMCLAQRHLDTKRGGAGDRTSNLPVPSQPALPPEPHAAPVFRSVVHLFCNHGARVSVTDSRSYSTGQRREGKGRRPSLWGNPDVGACQLSVTSRAPRRLGLTGLTPRALHGQPK